MADYIHVPDEAPAVPKIDVTVDENDYRPGALRLMKELRPSWKPSEIKMKLVSSLLLSMVGFLLGSYIAELYVDVGCVDMESITITPKDSRWVGAWWLGFLVSSSLLLVSSIPFWFLPRSLPKQGHETDKPTDPPSLILVGAESAQNSNQTIKLTEIAKGCILTAASHQTSNPSLWVFRLW
ncbi:solute carrier organic anion transporter family member 1C1-like [Xiphophorus couchianus]|uniref:solute carrier organic anion transporter family member 1C1-like n=1 Tax=Xiphophorus couchianus TaxID=32473 RepID=UPI0010163B05|nr:solute carrier organic anion transporter family member 1C1-like [Xiphophorus couchianus]